MKAVGFSPSAETNYQEKKQIATGLEERQQADMQNIQTHLAKSYNLHDPAGYTYWMRQSQLYQQAHPGLRPPAAGFGDYLREHAQAAGVAGALHTPIGVKPRDLTARGMVSFGNIGDR